jgi:hypothetical protein
VLPNDIPYVKYSPSEAVPLGFQLAKVDSFSSENARLITKEEISSLLCDIDP